MNWYYMSQGRQMGPVDRAALEALVRGGVILDDTLVWMEGTPAWQPYLAMRTAGQQAAPPTPVYGYAPAPAPLGGVYVAHPVPPYDLFDSGSVTLATVFGSPLAGGFLLALNHSRLGQSGKARGAFAIGLGLTVAGVLLGYAIPSSASAGLSVGLIVSMRAIAKGMDPAIAQHVAQGGPLASRWSAFGIGLGWLAALFAVIVGVVYGLETIRSGPSVAIGANDSISYTGTATRQDALALGAALKSAGFFTDRGATVQLTKGAPLGTVISFVVKDDTARKPGMVEAFQEVGRQVAPSVGGFPILVRLITAEKVIQKETVVGRVASGDKDEVYYFGVASEAQAKALGEALRSDGYFADQGSTVLLSKQDGGDTSLSFVVRDGFWEIPSNVVAFDALVRKVAPATGGLPVKLRLVSSSLDVKKEALVQ